MNLSYAPNSSNLLFEGSVGNQDLVASVPFDLADFTQYYHHHIPRVTLQLMAPVDVNNRGLDHPRSMFNTHFTAQIGEWHGTGQKLTDLRYIIHFGKMYMVNAGRHEQNQIADWIKAINTSHKDWADNAEIKGKTKPQLRRLRHVVQSAEQIEKSRKNRHIKTTFFPRIRFSFEELQELVKSLGFAMEMSAVSDRNSMPAEWTIYLDAGPGYTCNINFLEDDNLTFLNLSYPDLRLLSSVLIRQSDRDDSHNVRFNIRARANIAETDRILRQLKISDFENNGTVKGGIKVVIPGKASQPSRSAATAASTAAAAAAAAAATAAPNRQGRLQRHSITLDSRAYKVLGTAFLARRVEKYIYVPSTAETKRDFPWLDAIEVRVILEFSNFNRGEFKTSVSYCDIRVLFNAPLEMGVVITELRDQMWKLGLLISDAIEARLSA